jgi:hypothetical protein
MSSKSIPSFSSQALPDSLDYHVMNVFMHDQQDILQRRLLSLAVAIGFEPWHTCRGEHCSRSIPLSTGRYRAAAEFIGSAHLVANEELAAVLEGLCTVIALRSDITELYTDCERKAGDEGHSYFEGMLDDI